MYVSGSDGFEEAIVEWRPAISAEGAMIARVSQITLGVGVGCPPVFAGRSFRKHHKS